MADDFYLWTLIKFALCFCLFTFALIPLSCVRIPRKKPEDEPSIPSALDDWDEEFKRITGTAPFPAPLPRWGSGNSLQNTTSTNNVTISVFGLAHTKEQG